MRWRECKQRLLTIHISAVDQMTVDKFILWAAFVVAFITYTFWNVIRNAFNIPVFYLGNSFFVFLLSLYLLKENRTSLVCFLIFGVAFNNLLDEIFFDATQIQLNEILLLILMPFIWFVKTKRNARKNT